MTLRASKQFLLPVICVWFIQKSSEYSCGSPLTNQYGRLKQLGPVGNLFCHEHLSPRLRRCHCWLTKWSGSIPSCVARGLWAADAPEWSPSGPWSGCDRDSGASTSSGWWQSRYQTPQHALMLQWRQKYQELVLHLLLGRGEKTKFEFRFVICADDTIPVSPMLLWDWSIIKVAFFHLFCAYLQSTWCILRRSFPSQCWLKRSQSPRWSNCSERSTAMSHRSSWRTAHRSALDRLAASLSSWYC